MGNTRTRLGRLKERGSQDRDLAYSILDEGLVCHVGICDAGEPFVIPMLYVRDSERVLLHGSVKSRLMRRLAEGCDACVTVTHLDGLVLARSAFNHSANYRSLIMFGRAGEITREPEKRRALDKLVEGLVPGGRVDEARRADRQELKATTIVTFPIREFSIKSRSGPPSDKAGDMALPVWTGELPLATRILDPVAAPDCDPEQPVPEYLRNYRRPG